MKKLLFLSIITLLFVNCDDDDLKNIEGSRWKCAIENPPEYKYHLLYLKDGVFNYEFWHNNDVLVEYEGTYTYKEPNLTLFLDGKEITYRVEKKVGQVMTAMGDYEPLSQYFSMAGYHGYKKEK